MIIIGIDFHPEFQQIASVDTETGEFQEKRLAHREDAETFYRALAGQKVRVGMEASGHARWFERLLAELQFELWIGDAAEIPVLPAWYPNLRKVILQHESQNQLCILSIGLLFAHSFALDLGRVANPQLKLQLGQQSFEPACMPTSFHSNTHVLSRQCQVERFRVLTMC